MKRRSILAMITALMACSLTAYSQTPDLNGKWIRKPVDGSVSNVAISIVQSGAAFTLKVDGKAINGSIKGNTFLVNAFDEVGIIEQNGNLIRWPGGDTWVKAGGVATIPVLPSPPIAQAPVTTTTLDLNGTWSSFFDDGRKQDADISIRQTNNSLLISISELGERTNIAGKITGVTMTMTGQTSYGTVSADGKRIKLSDGTYWQRASGVSAGSKVPEKDPSPAAKMPERDPSSSSTSSRVVEQDPASTRKTAQERCSEAVQGKIAWNRAGTTSWSTGNVTALCQGTTDPDATILCFKYEIQTHDDWARAIRTCKGAAAVPSGVADLNGQWTYYAADGTPFRNAAVIAQTGANLRFDNGDGSGSQGDVKGTVINAWGWHLTGTLTEDGRTINWSNGTKWVKQ
ncbi:MAG TPA: hypothetical protein VGO43_09575 [Pyrinomonadaceae bacterium]|nr:hypothetical protein [Pyrinomonadaceae bacterium]